MNFRYLPLATVCAAILGSTVAAPAPGIAAALETRQSFNTSTICESANNRNGANWNASGVWDWFDIVADSMGPPASSDATQVNGQIVGVSWDWTVFDLVSSLVSRTPGFTCSPGDCNINIDEAACLNSPQATFVLYNMVNFNNYLNSMGQSIASTQQFVSGMTANMVQTFTSLESESDVPASGLSNGISITSAVLGVLGAFIPPIAPETGAASSVLGLFSSLLGLTSSAPDFGELLFNDLAGAQTVLANLTGTIENAIYIYANNTLNSVPQATSSTWDYSSDPEGLVQIFWDGTFAAPLDNTLLPVDTDIVSFLASPVINYLWSTQDTFIVIINNDVSADICNANIFPGQSFCDDSGALHVILQWALSESYASGGNFEEETNLVISQVDQVQGYDNLTTYGLTLQDVDAASNYWQNLYGYNGIPNNSEIISALTSSPIADLSQLYYFNLPVCSLDLFWSSGNANLLSLCAGSDDLQDCITGAIVFLCCQQQVLGQNWPYSLPSDFTCGDFSQY